jgi:raffinose/stachyose/melibiose transport system substrate-binding protein
MSALKASDTTIPTTFSELLTQCRTAASHGAAFVGVSGGQQGAGLGSLFLAALGSETVLGTNPNWVSDRTSGKATFADTTEWKAAVSQFVQMKNAGCYPQGSAGIGTPQQLSELGSGKVVTGVVPADALSQALETTKNAHFEMVPFPGNTSSSTRVPISFGQGLGISKTSKHLAQAQQFLTFLSEPKEQKLLADGLGGISLAQYNAGQLSGALAPIKQDVSAKRTTAYMPIAFPNPNVLTVMGDDVTGLLTGQTSSSAALTGLDKAWGSAK